MELLTPFEVMMWSYVSAAVTGLVPLLRSDKPIGIRLVAYHLLFYGAAGCGLGAFAYEYLGGKEKPWLVIACAMLVGIGAIRVSDITTIFRRLLGASNGERSARDDK